MVQYPLIEYLLIVLVLTGLTCLLVAWKAEGRPPGNRGVKVKYLWNYDGDTITFLVRGRKEKVRVRHVDTPELDDPPDRHRAYAVKKFVKAVVTGGRDVRLVDVKGRDRYGRLLSRVEIDGRDLGAMLLDKGLARRWVEYNRRRR